MSRPIVILSYRQNWERRCSRSCNCLHGRGDSDFDTHLAANEEEAATYIAKRIKEDDDASYTHCLLTRWEEVVALGRSYSTSPAGGEQSIQIPYTDVEDYEGGYAEYDAFEEEEAWRNQMHATVMNLVKEKLAVKTSK